MTTKKTLMPKSADPAKGRPVLVTTEARGVFFGYLVGEEVGPEKVTLDHMRNVVMWDTATRGFLGLASTGPTDGCRITAAAGVGSVLHKITGVIGCTPEAVARFEAGPWAR
jgi:hypothetical protein